MTWWAGRMACLDTESTAPDPTVARIVQAAFCYVGGGDPAEKQVWLADPGVEIPAGATEVHGITTERARAEGLPLEVVVGALAANLEWAAELGVPVVVMNAPYDLPLIQCELRRLGLSRLTLPPIIDVKVLDKQADVYRGFHRRGSRKLSDLCAYYEATIDGAHDACHDAMAAARVAYRIGQRVEKLGALTLAELQPLQAQWYREQAEGLEAYWIKKGDPRRVDNFEWPLRRAA